MAKRYSATMATIVLDAVVIPVCLACSSGKDAQADSGKDAQTEEPCAQNSDCADSAVAAEWAAVKCGSEVYCLSGRCLGHCRELCEAVRTDVNPCGDGGLCVTLYQSEQDEVAVCTMLPVACEAAEDCPSYRPETDAGGSAEWTCVDGTCAYPGFEYTTH